MKCLHRQGVYNDVFDIVYSTIIIFFVKTSHEYYVHVHKYINTVKLWFVKV